MPPKYMHTHMHANNSFNPAYTCNCAARNSTMKLVCCHDSDIQTASPSLECAGVTASVSICASVN